MDDHEELVNLRQLNPSQKIVEVEHDMIEVRAKPEQSGDTNEEEGDESGHKHSEKCSHGSGKSKKGGKKQKNYSIIVYCVFTCFSCVYLETQCFYPLLEDISHRRILSCISFFIVFMALWSYYQTIANNNFLPKVRGAPNLIDIRKNVDSNYLLNNCQRCHYYKPPRVSHCSTCGGCIMKLDHHCFWTQNCIGFRNQRTFYCYVMYMTAGVLQYWCATLGVLSKINGSCKFFSYFQPGIYVLWLITSLSAFVVGMMILMLAISHSMYIATNHTTLMSMKSQKVCPCPICEFRELLLDNQSINQYDRGQIQNIRGLFGKNIFLAFLPFVRQIQNDFVFEVTNPIPSPLQVAKFTGDYEAETMREQEISANLTNLKELYKEKKFMINGGVIEV